MTCSFSIYSTLWLIACISAAEFCSCALPACLAHMIFVLTPANICLPVALAYFIIPMTRFTLGSCDNQTPFARNRDDLMAHISPM